MPLLPGFLSWFCVQILLGSFIGVVSLLWRFIVGSGVMSVGVFSMVGPTMFLSLFVCGMGGFRTLVRDEGDVILLITERFGGRDLWTVFIRIRIRVLLRVEVKVTCGSRAVLFVANSNSSNFFSCGEWVDGQFAYDFPFAPRAILFDSIRGTPAIGLRPERYPGIFFKSSGCQSRLGSGFNSRKAEDSEGWWCTIVTFVVLSFTRWGELFLAVMDRWDESFCSKRRLRGCLCRLRATGVESTILIRIVAVRIGIACLMNAIAETGERFEIDIGVVGQVTGDLFTDMVCDPVY